MSTFEEIYTKYYSRMVRIAQKMLGDKENAADIVQVVFIYLFTKLNNGTVFLNPGSWLYRATINKCIDYLRKQKRFQNIESLNECKIEEELIEKKETTVAINMAISKLKPKEKVLAVLYSEGLSYKEIAEASGIKFSSIGKTLARTLEKLEKELKKQHYELY